MSDFTNEPDNSEQPKENFSSGILGHIRQIISKSLGRQTVVFLVFLFISAVLWLIKSLNENLQRNLTCEIKIVNVPDSVTFISRVPSKLYLNVSGRGTQLIKYQLGNDPVLEIDFPKYRTGNSVGLSEADLSSNLQNLLGSEVRIQRMDLDSIFIQFTTLPGRTVTVRPDCSVKPVLTARLMGEPVVSPETVKLYSALKERLNTTSVTTEPIDVKDIKESFTHRVRVLTAPGVRAIPDSVDVRVNIEQLVYRSEEVPIVTINTPPNIKIIPNPPTVRVDYLVPASSPNMRPDLTVVADYRSLKGSLTSDKIAIRLLHPDDNVFLSSDSVYYLAEILQDDEN
ncbi:MAG: hypothetical protein K2K84_07495 [Muribaculaceae bacterium]|nr:hypothetical protein [Muribaculaceae bacterium]